MHVTTFSGHDVRDNKFELVAREREFRFLTFSTNEKVFIVCNQCLELFFKKSS